LPTETTPEDDYKTEITQAEDPTLASTNTAESSAIATGLVQWGGDYVPIYTQLRDPSHTTRYTKEAAPLATFHGSDDGVICPSQENSMIAGYAVLPLVVSYFYQPLVKVTFHVGILLLTGCLHTGTPRLGCHTNSTFCRGQGMAPTQHLSLSQTAQMSHNTLSCSSLFPASKS
jgi:hypothetical protein